jgi:class 3 adenylate cyclase/tetratricopeptide (TPR) repeat protein
VVAGAAEERRVVTVLFGDLVGFTSLAERLDPEHVKRLVEACFERLVDDVVAYGGRVDKLLGDAIVALFGAPVAHEDDAERAVRAALRMQSTLLDQVSNLGAGATPIRMRIGINTGEVLVGKLAGTDYTAMGDVMNAAARLQEAAPPGGVLVGDVTYSRTSDAIRYQPAGELVVKGRAQPINTWLAHEALAPPGGRRRRRDVPLVGRSTEMRLGRAALDVAMQGKRAVLLAIEGEGGAGKSRLVEELLAPIRERALVLEGAGVPYGEANVWWPIASALIDRLELDTNAPPATSAAAARELVLEHGQVLLGNDHPEELENLADAFCHLLGHPSGLDAMDPAGAREALFRAVTAVLQAMLAESPVVLAVTDAHWADPHVLELLARVAGSLAHAPFALITTSRADADLRWPPASSRVTVVAIPLEPLSRDAAARIIWSVVGEELDDATIAQIYDRSGGNPLFLEELAELVADGGDVGQLPDSLRGLVAARLDRLAPAQRAVLDNAAVLGTTGFLFSLEKFANELGQPFDDSLVEALVGQGLLEVDGRRWRFRSDSVREVAYQTLTKSVRAARHAGVARSMAGAGVHAPLDDLAHHAATAAELVAELGPVVGVPDDMSEQAVGHLVIAAERASEQGSLHTVVRHTTRAIDLLGLDASVRGRPVLLLRAGAEVESRDYRAARHDIDQVLDAALAEGDVVSEAEARRLLGMIHQQHLEIDRARDELGRAVELLKDSGERAPLARALRARGFLELFGGSLQDAEWFFGEAESVYRELDDRRGLAWVEQHRAWASFLSGDVAQAEARLHAAAAALHEVGDRSGVGWAFGLLAFVHFINRRYAEAEELARTVIEEASERGEEWGLGMMQVLLANLRIWQGNPEEALALAEQARSRFRRLGDRYGLLQAMVPLLRSLVATGRQAATARELEELIAIGRSFGGEAFGSLAAGGAMMHAGDGQKAVELTSEAIAQQQFIGVSVFEPHVVQAVGLAQCGQIDEARAALESVMPEQADNPFCRAAAALVAVLDGRCAEAIEWSTGVDTAHAASWGWRSSRPGRRGRPTTQRR